MVLATKMLGGLTNLLDGDGPSRRRVAKWVVISAILPGKWVAHATCQRFKNLPDPNKHPPKTFHRSLELSTTR